MTTCRVYVILFQGTSGPRPAYAGNGGQGKSGPRGPPVGSNITPQQTNIGGNSIYRGGTWGGGANPYPSLRYATPMGPTNATSYSAGYTHQPSVSSKFTWPGTVLRQFLVNQRYSISTVQTHEYVELYYNDLPLYDTSSITLFIQSYQLIPHKARVFLACLVRHT